MSRAQEFFHGTEADVVGPKILPARESGHVHTGVFGSVGGTKSIDHAFASPSEEEAWDYAQIAGPLGKGRARVYAVHPHPDMKVGGYAKEYVAPYYKIKHRIDIKPGRQGTFPQLNWNQFGPPSVGDANHPDAEEQEHGRETEAQRMRRKASTPEPGRIRQLGGQLQMVNQFGQIATGL